MDFELENDLRKELTGGEKLLWTGRPKAGFVLRSADVFLIPFSLFWCGFALFWEFGVIATGAPFFFKIWGIPFVLVGLYMTIGRFFVDSIRRKNTRYGITDNRVIIKSGIISKEIKLTFIMYVLNVKYNTNKSESKFLFTYRISVKDLIKSQSYF